MPLLREVSGPEPGRTVRIDRPKMLLGRHPDCDIVIEVGAVSRHHAQVVVDNGDYYVEDLQSRNGTFVNEEIIHNRHLLNQNDQLRVCDVSFRFEWTASDAQWQEQRSDGSSSRAVLVDDLDTPSSTIMSRLEVSKQDGSVRVTSSSEVKLAALLEITQSLGRAISLDEVLPQVLNSLFKVFTQADRGFIVLQQGKQLIPRWTKVRREDQEDSLRISRTIVRQVIEQREAILSADAASDERFEMSESIADFRIRSMMCVPLINSEDEVLGVLQIDTLNQRSRFQPTDLEVLASVATQAAIAIDNAQLHERAVLQRSLQRELEVANQVQQSFLPQNRPTIPQYEFADYYRPANQIGGDYFDYVQLPDGRMAVIIADVVGHGVAAALLMAKLSSEARFSLATSDGPAEVVTRLNKVLCDDSIDDRFVTLVLAVFDPRSHEISLVNAGHMSPIRCLSADAIDEVGTSQAGLPLGVMDDVEYETFVFGLEAGQSLVLYTDGISEAANGSGELFGLHRVRKEVSANAAGPEAIVRGLVASVQHFCGSQSPGDDMCLVCFGRTNNSAA